MPPSFSLPAPSDLSTSCSCCKGRKDRRRGDYVSDGVCIRPSRVSIIHGEGPGNHGSTI